MILKHDKCGPFEDKIKELQEENTKLKNELEEAKSYKHICSLCGGTGLKVSLGDDGDFKKGKCWCKI